MDEVPRTAHVDSGTGSPDKTTGKFAFNTESLLRNWPVYLAIVTGLFYLLGYARERGYRSTLGISALSSSGFKEQYIIDGLFALLSFVFPPIAVLAISVVTSACLRPLLKVRLISGLRHASLLVWEHAALVRKMKSARTVIVLLIILLNGTIVVLDEVLLALAGLPLKAGPRSTVCGCRFSPMKPGS